ncbi:MAG: TSUP family transporter [Acidimicrobiia bacterium]
MSLMVWLIALAITAGAAAVQGTVGVGFAMIAVPLLSLVNPDLAPVPQLLVILPMTFVMAWREREAMDLRGVGWIVVGRLPGLAIGVALLAVATQRILDLFIGVVVLAAVVVLATGFHVKRTSATKFAAGLGSGTTGVVASIGGPPVALLYSDEEAATVRATLAAVFTIGVSLSAIARVSTGNITAQDVRVALVLFPAVVAGYLVSIRYKDRIPAGTVRVAILIVSGFAAAALIGRAIAG